jgi:hypothetical protein
MISQRLFFLAWGTLALLTLCLPHLGCGEGGVPADAATVQGVVTFNGDPVSDATVTFRSDDNRSAVGKTDEQGQYKLSSPQIPGGAAPGTYKITVTKREQLQTESITEEHPDYGKPMPAPPEPKHLLPQKYSQPNTSGLEATITQGANEVPLELTD